MLQKLTRIKCDPYTCFSSHSDDIFLKEPPKDPLLQLISLQKASGSWVLDPALAPALGKTSKEVENAKPSAVS